MPLENRQETTASESVQPEETQGIPDESREESANVDYEASTEVAEHDSTPATPVESVHATPSSEPRRRREDEESDPFDVDFNTILIYFRFGTNGHDSGRSRRTKQKQTRTSRST
jgi:hypothetical protein